MKNVNKGLTIPKWVLINQPKILLMLQNLSAKFSTQAQNFGISMKKGSIGRPQSVSQVVGHFRVHEFPVLFKSILSCIQVRLINQGFHPKNQSMIVQKFYILLFSVWHPQAEWMVVLIFCAKKFRKVVQIHCHILD